MSNNTMKHYVDEFGKHLKTALESICNMANVYARACNEDYDSAIDAFGEAYPHVTENTWNKLRLIGNGAANPNIMFFSDAFAAKIIRMPKFKQDAVLNGDSFEVFNPTTRQVDNIGYASIKPRHERILFSDSTGSVRTISEQVDFCDKVAAARKSANVPYTVRTDCIEVHHECRISKHELESALEEMS